MCSSDLTIARQDELAPVLPRPMAIYSANPGQGTFDVVYRTVGSGTQRMATWAPGERMTVVGPLGRGFTIPRNARSILVLGRGIGICSITSLVHEATELGVEVTVAVLVTVPAVTALDPLVSSPPTVNWPLCMSSVPPPFTSRTAPNTELPVAVVLRIVPLFTTVSNTPSSPDSRALFWISHSPPAWLFTTVPLPDTPKIGRAHV